MHRIRKEGIDSTLPLARRFQRSPAKRRLVPKLEGIGSACLGSIPRFKGSVPSFKMHEERMGSVPGHYRSIYCTEISHIVTAEAEQRRCYIGTCKHVNNKTGQWIKGSFVAVILQIRPAQSEIRKIIYLPNHCKHSSIYHPK